MSTDWITIVNATEDSETLIVVTSSRGLYLQIGKEGQEQVSKFDLTDKTAQLLVDTLETVIDFRS